MSDNRRVMCGEPPYDVYLKKKLQLLLMLYLDELNTAGKVYMEREVSNHLNSILRRYRVLRNEFLLPYETSGSMHEAEDFRKA